MNDLFYWLTGWTVFCLAMIIMKFLDNQRRVIRNVLHGQVTYTIKGYDGHRAVEIAQALEKDHQATGRWNVADPAEPDELEHRPVRSSVAMDGPHCGDTTCLQGHGPTGRHTGPLDTPDRWNKS